VGAAAPVGAMKHGPAGRQTACWKTFADGGKAVPLPSRMRGRRSACAPPDPVARGSGFEAVRYRDRSSSGPSAQRINAPTPAITHPLGEEQGP
jgi:hypothetical protein